MPLNLNDIAAGMREDAPPARRRGHRLRPGPRARTSGRVRADPGQIEQVIMNLAVNARDAMPRGGKLTIETANVELDEEYAARHVDVKPGPVRPARGHRHRLRHGRRRRRRSSSSRSSRPRSRGKGTGLGLSTVYGIVKQSGGHIWVVQRARAGARRSRSTSRATPPRNGGPLKAPAGVDAKFTGTETILVVEDEEQLRKVARRALEAAGLHGAHRLERRGGAPARRAARGRDPPALHRRRHAADERHGARARAGEGPAGPPGPLHVGLHRRRHPAPRRRSTPGRTSSGSRSRPPT